MVLLAVNWVSIGIKASQLILSLSILIVMHEFGHFLPAKLFGCRIEKFFLFFDPWFALFKKKIGDTVYGLGWLPLGGYVKISGMIDESMDTAQLNEPAQPWEFRSKPAWQRLIVMVGGVTVNIILSFFIFAMILWKWGEEYLPAKNLKYGVYVDSVGQKIGLRNGDKILTLNGKELDNFDRLSSLIILEEAKTIGIERDGQQMELPIPTGTIRGILKRKGDPVALPQYPLVVDSVDQKSARFESGSLQKGDQIIGLNGVTVNSFYQFHEMIAPHKKEILDLAVLRGTDTVHIRAYTNEKSQVGFLPAPESRFLTYTRREYGFFESFPAGIKKGWNTLVMNVTNLKLIFTSPEVKASESVGSFITIGNMFGDHWDWGHFWSMTALLSVVLAFMNILPIPALDGGHVLFILYEMITGRKPGDKFMEYAQIVGMVMIFALMIYAVGLDVFRLFK